MCADSNKPGLENFMGSGWMLQILPGVEYFPDHKGEYKAKWSSSLLQLAKRGTVDSTSFELVQHSISGVQYWDSNTPGLCRVELQSPALQPNLEECMCVQVKLIWDEQGQLDRQKLAMLQYEEDLRCNKAVTKIQIQNLYVFSQPAF